MYSQTDFGLFLFRSLDLSIKEVCPSYQNPLLNIFDFEEWSFSFKLMLVFPFKMA